MAWNVVIAGGGFGGLYAARRLERLPPRHSAKMGLFFGRASAELGQLGHPPPLAPYSEESPGDEAQA
jgi:hypothetical protein